MGLLDKALTLKEHPHGLLYKAQLLKSSDKSFSTGTYPALNPEAVTSTRSAVPASADNGRLSSAMSSLLQDMKQFISDSFAGDKNILVIKILLKYLDRYPDLLQKTVDVLNRLFHRGLVLRIPEKGAVILLPFMETDNELILHQVGLNLGDIAEDIQEDFTISSRSFRKESGVPQELLTILL